MNTNTIRGLDNAIKNLFSTSEFDRLRLFLIADASAEKSEAEEIIKTIGDAIRAHLIEHGKAVRAIAAGKRSL